jgi:hypothetical protein
MFAPLISEGLLGNQQLGFYCSCAVWCGLTRAAFVLIIEPSEERWAQGKTRCRIAQPPKA